MRIMSWLLLIVIALLWVFAITVMGSLLNFPKLAVNMLQISFPAGIAIGVIFDELFAPEEE